MLTSIDNVLTIFKDQAKPYWKIYEGWDAKLAANILATSADNVTDVKSSETQLEQYLRFLAPGKYLISIRDTPTAQTNNVNVRLDIPYTQGQTGNVGNVTGNAFAGAAMGDYMHKDTVTAKLLAQEKEFDLKQLKKDFEDFKKDKTKEPKKTVLENFLEQHAPLLLAIFAARNGVAPGSQVALAGFGLQQQAPVNNIPPINTENMNAQNPSPVAGYTHEQKLAWVLDSLTAEFGSQENAIDFLTKLLVYKTQNAAMFEVIKPNILNTNI